MSGTLLSPSAYGQAGLLDPAEYLKNFPIKSVMEQKTQCGFSLVSLDENCSVDQAMKVRCFHSHASSAAYAVCALQVLGDNNFQAVPVTSLSGSYLGFLTQIELVNFCLSVSMDASTTSAQGHPDPQCDIDRLKEQGRRAFAETKIGSLLNRPSHSTRKLLNVVSFVRLVSDAAPLRSRKLASDGISVDYHRLE